MAFEPKILGFLCNWCCYAAADTAGVSRFQYPPNLKVIRVMCSGRVAPEFIFDAFINGADGVFIGGCHLGDCQYLYGNYEATVVVKMSSEILKQIGINPDRLLLSWHSATEGSQFAQKISEFTEKIRSLGPLGESEGLARDVVVERLKAVIEGLKGRKIRMAFGKMCKRIRGQNKYSDKAFIEEEINRRLIVPIKEKVFKGA
ncbi:MAG: hydrogenase iron-sulfur subunit [Deltaproteobacteria bacterium]|nr:hydrogenase iron-sulfur subunit [Deltaproteobacteria bacterium]